MVVKKIIAFSFSLTHKSFNTLKKNNKYFTFSFVNLWIISKNILKNMWNEI